MVLFHVRAASHTLTIVRDGLRCLARYQSKLLRTMMLNTKQLRSNVLGMGILAWRPKHCRDLASRRVRGRGTFMNKPLGSRSKFLLCSKNYDINSSLNLVTDRSCLSVKVNGNFDTRGNLGFDEYLRRLFVGMKDLRILGLGLSRIIQNLWVRNSLLLGLYRVVLRFMRNKSPHHPTKRRPRSLDTIIRLLVYILPTPGVQMGKLRSSNGVLERKSYSIEVFLISTRRTSAPEGLPLSLRLSKELKLNCLVLPPRLASMSLVASFLESAAVLVCQLPSEAGLQPP